MRAKAMSHTRSMNNMTKDVNLGKSSSSIHKRLAANNSVMNPMYTDAEAAYMQ